MHQKRKMRVFLLLIFIPFFNGYSQSPIDKGLETITISSIRGPLKFLSSDRLQGREPGMNGGYIAADYIASLFEAYGLTPAGENDSYFQPVDLIVTDNNLATHTINIVSHNGSGTSSKGFEQDVDFLAPPIFRSLSIESNIAFVGYGMAGKNFNELEKLKTKGLVLLRLKGIPGQQDTLSKAFKYYSDKDKKEIEKERNEEAEALSVTAILEFDPADPRLMAQKEKLNNNVTGAGNCEGKQHPHYSGIYTKNFRLLSDESNVIPVYSVSQSLLAALFPDWKNMISAAIRNGKKLNVQPPVVSDKKIHIKGIAVTKQIRTENIIAVVEGSEKPDEIIVVGAHYDHLGAYNGFIWNGADDNASGAVGMVGIARAFAATGTRPKRTVIFAGWTAEERGLLGSKYFLNTFPHPEKILYYHNYDMIGRSYDPAKPDSSVALLYTKSWSDAEKLARKAVEKYHLGLKINYSAWDNPTSGSDNATFAKKSIPIMWFHTGGHPEYHHPGDHADKIDWQKMRDIIKTSFVTLWELANE